MQPELRRGQKVTVRLSGAEVIQQMTFGDLAPMSRDSYLDLLECAEPETPDELRARARALGNKKTHNAAGRRWWEQSKWDRRR
jgi:hypothetical protein